MATAGGEEERASEPWPGAGTEAVGVTGNTPRPGCVLGAVRITNGRTELQPHKGREGRAGKTALMRTRRCIPGERETQKCKQARSRDYLWPNKSCRIQRVQAASGSSGTSESLKPAT